MYNRPTMDLPIPPLPASATPPRVMVVVPTYNEVENLSSIVAELLGLDVVGLHVLIVDDESPDGTGDVADLLCIQHPGRVGVLHRSGERGLGKAYVEGFRRALDAGAEFIIQMDADFSHSPQVVPVFLTRIADVDVVVGSRYVAGGELDEHWSWRRRFLSWGANAAYARILGMSVRDATGGFKCWRREVLDAIDLSKVRSGGYVFQVEMAYLAQALGFRVLEIPIHFEDRRIGQSKMSTSVKLEAAWRAWEIKWRYRHLGGRRRRDASVAAGDDR